MTQNLTFYGWQRSGVYAHALPGGTIEEGRLLGNVSITLQDRDTNRLVGRPVAFVIAGPRDVEGLLPGAITARVPPPNSVNAETTKCVYVEFGAPDLPWRYTPQVATSLVLRPWIVLVVGTPDDVQLGPNNRVTLSTSVMNAHALEDSARWAHVQDDGERVISRLLSPRMLPEDSECVAAIVPTFNEEGELSWLRGVTEPLVLPCYHAWDFRTGEAGDFKTLATRLKSGQAGSKAGRAPLRYHRGSLTANLSVRGALAPIGGTDGSLDSRVSEDIKQLLTPSADEHGRPVIGLPHYGEPWGADPTTTTWYGTANHDPRHRGAAGLGLWAGIELQQEIVDAAADQVGALDAAEQRIRNLTMGLGAVRSLWTHRLPTDPAQRLLLYGPSLRRMVTAEGTALDTIAGKERSLPPRLFSSAARRVLRAGPARTSLADPKATVPAGILEQANACPPEPERVVDGLPHADEAAAILNAADLDTLVHKGPDVTGFITTFLDEVGQSEFCKEGTNLEHLWQLVNENKDNEDSRYMHLAYLAEILAAVQIGDGQEAERLAGEIPAADEELDRDSLTDLAAELINDPPKRPCTPVNLKKLEEQLTAAIAPTGDDAPIIQRVLSGIDGLGDKPLAPVEVCVGLDYPVWTFLRDRAPDWLLPGVSSLEKDAVVGMESNPVFVDAFLLGLNTQVLSELRWRNLHIATGCTPMRTFWDKLNPNASGHVPDIHGIEVWNEASELGDASHQPPPEAAGGDLVLVFRSELFRRYPDTSLYVAPAPLDAYGEPRWNADTLFEDEDRLIPNFQGSIGDDITFFRFDVDATEALKYWVVLEEPPSGYAFYSTTTSTGPDGATFAHEAFCDPVRVLIRGDSLIPHGG